MCVYSHKCSRLFYLNLGGLSIIIVGHYKVILYIPHTLEADESPKQVIAHVQDNHSENSKRFSISTFAYICYS